MENRIAALRKARRISQAELAEAVSVTRQGTSREMPRRAWMPP